MKIYPPKFIVKSGDTLMNRNIKGFITDAVALMGDSSSVTGCIMDDSTGNNSAHRDFIQPRQLGNNANGQMMGACSSLNTIFKNTMKSVWKCQGVFSSDGGFFDIYVVDNIITTNSQHKITLGGVFTGTFGNNRDENGKPVKVVLNKMRIGGGLAKSFHVSTFLNNKYEQVKVDATTDLDDNRLIPSDEDVLFCVDDFDLELWQHLAKITKHPHGDFEKHFNDVLKGYEEIKGELMSNVAKTKIALISGHNEKSQGKARFGTTEWIFGNELIEDLLPLLNALPNIEVEVFSRIKNTDYPAEMKELHSRVDAWGADLSMEFHYNAFAGAAKGHEVLHLSSSKGGKRMADLMDKAYDLYLNNADRGRKEVPVGGRGSYGLRVGRAIALIVEPFFSKELKEFMRGGSQRQNLIDSYVHFFKNL